MEPIERITRRPRRLLAATYWTAATVVADDAARRDKAGDLRRRCVASYITAAHAAANARIGE